MKHRKSIFILLTIVCSVLLSGCWSYSEIDERLVVGTVGIDYAKKKDMYRITIRAINAKPTASGIELVPVVISTEGKSVFEAIRKSAPLYGRKTYWSHLQSIIISDKVAQEDVFKTLDFFYRDAEVRQDNMLYISCGSSAEEVVRLEAVLQKERQFTLRYAMRTQKFVGTFPEQDLVEFGSKILEETIKPIVPIITIYKDQGKDMIRIEGSAVFLNRRMVGKLSPHETLVVVLLRNEFKNPLMVSTINEGKDLTEAKLATMEIFDSRTKIKSSKKSDGENISVLVSIELNAGVGEMNYPMNYVDEKSIKNLKNTVEADIRDRILKTVKFVQQDYKSDVFGFGKAVEISNPKLWNNLKNEWDKEFSKVPVEVQVTVNIENTGKVVSTE
ncbi:Ger(x)C family spore germination protein [Clostridium sp. A1-XYC3]|uniref:Ger(X)C family spore germination protein n=1 Tax=Clostridium tanneri TaxID=3037988 RepID=A0ABU4JVA7_9CLOT|nr:Ger(x)C family spore germination protein [Clostridium sp. A1-XYC3]MDW8802089.1 Ger(x)C family spore germination protein [Clostridium sp. A1-XYC3]